MTSLLLVVVVVRPTVRVRATVKPVKAMLCKGLRWCAWKKSGTEMRGIRQSNLLNKVRPLDSVAGRQSYLVSYGPGCC